MEKWKCNFCGKTFELKNQHTKSSHMKACDDWMRIKTDKLSKEFLYEEYIINEKSAIEIAKEIGLDSARVVINYLNKFDIPKRNIISSRATKRNKIKQEETNIKKYGVTNPMKTESIKGKVFNTKQKKYGSGYFNNMDKYVKTMLERHGIKYGVIKAHEDFISKPHKIVLEYLKELRLVCETSYEVGKFYTDIFVNGKIIEVYGDFWHANPLIYDAKDVVNYPNKPRIAENIWRIDEYRINYIKKFGYDVLVLWENDILKNFDKVKKNIHDYLLV
jgi:hypothetical protein